MKVRELIEQLSKLEQDKEIKIVCAYGWEYEEETEPDFCVVNYKELECDNGTQKYYPVDDESDNKDFYLITGKNYK